MEKILVVGATGTTGKQIVQLLEHSQYFSPVAMVRKKEQEAFFKAKQCATVLADLEDTVDHALVGMDKVIFAAGSGGSNVEEVDKKGAMKIVDAAKNHNLKKMVMLSSMGADRPKAVPELEDYLKAKQAADIYLKESGVSYSIVRPSTLNDTPGTHKIRLSASFDDTGEIPRADVAEVLVRCLHDDSALNVSFEIQSGDTPIGIVLEQTETVKR